MSDQTRFKAEPDQNSPSFHSQEKSNPVPTFKTSVDLFSIRKNDTKRQGAHDSLHLSTKETNLSTLSSPHSRIKTEGAVNKKHLTSRISANISASRVRKTLESSLLLNNNTKQSSSTLLDIPDYKGPRTIDFNQRGMGNGFISNSSRLPKVSQYPNSGPGPGSYHIKGIAELARSHRRIAGNLKSVLGTTSYPVLVLNQEKRPPVGAYDYSLDTVRKNGIVSCSYSFTSKTQKNYGIKKPEGPNPVSYDIRGSEELQQNRLNQHKSSYFAKPIEKRKNMLEIGKTFGLDEQTGRKMEFVNVVYKDAAKLHKTIESKIHDKSALSQESNRNTLKRPSPTLLRYKSIRSIRKVMPYALIIENAGGNKANHETSGDKSPKKFYL